MESLLNDLRYSLRSLRRTPVFTVIAILTLAIGIGANGAIFSVVNGVILKPLDYRQPNQLVMVYSEFPTMNFERFWMSAPELLELKERATSFESLGAFANRFVSLVGSEQPMRVSSATLNAELWEVLGVPAQIGRTFGVEDDQPGAERTAVLSHQLWQRAFGGDRDALGRKVDINGQPTTILGVMPPNFDLDGHGFEIWLPLQLDPANPGGRASHYLHGVARLADGKTIDDARTEVAFLVEGWEESVGEGHAPRPEGHPLRLEPLHEELIGDTRPALLALFGAVGFVLLIACANVANLLLARAETRQKEIAVRTAMGASRWRLVRQLLTESVLLALVGGGLGLLFGHWGLRALLRANPESLPRTGEVGLDLPVVIFTAAIAALTGILFGLAPALNVRIGQLSGVLKEGGHQATSSGARMALRRLLVISEIALAVVLVVGSGLMIRSFWNLMQVDKGFQSTGRMTFETYVPPSDYEQPADIAAFYTRLVTELESTAGIESAAVMTGLPPLRRLDANDTEFENLERTEDGPPHNIDYYQTVSTNYFDTMGIQIVEGRAFRDTDTGEATPVALINEQAAKIFYPGESPIGRRLRPCCGDDAPWLSIVGIVRDVKQGGVDQAVGTELYFNLPQTAAAGFAPRTMNIVVQSALGPEATSAELRRQVWSLDPKLPLAKMRPLDEVVTDSLSRPRFLTLLLVLFGGIALLLAAIGTYGVISYSVERRHQEIGIRLAMGAETRSVVGLVLGQGLLLAAIGIVVGIGASLALTRVVESMLFGTRGNDPVTFVAVSGLLVLVAALACWIPARRAAGLDPLVVLRYE